MLRSSERWSSMNEKVTAEDRLALIETRVRTLEASALRAADGLREFQGRLIRVERLLGARRNVERLEERER